MVKERDEELLAELLLQWEELQEQGQQVSPTDLCKDHPHLVKELAQRINALTTISWLDAPVDLVPDTQPAAGESDIRVLAGRYRLESLVAEGGFAQVWRGYDEELERFVAIKLPKRSQIQSTAAFVAEARRLAKLKHPGIVPVYDVERESGICFIVSELIEGGTLEERIVANSFTADQAVQWITQVAESLAYAHGNGIIHQDIKPANILVDRNNRAMLTDFGIHHSAMCIGTLRYMSPEQLAGGDVDARTDVYSLGVVLHELLTGTLPYSSSDPVALRRHILNGALVTRLAAPHKAICEKAMQHNPAERFQSLSDMAAELQRSVNVKPRATRKWMGLVPLSLVLIASSIFLPARLRDSKTDESVVLKGGPQFVSLAFSPDGKQLLAGELFHTVRLWNVQTHAPGQKFLGLKDWVRCVDYSRDGTCVVAGSGGNSVEGQLEAGSNNVAILWDAHTGQELQRFGPFGSPITAIALSDDGNEVLTGSDDAKVRLWDRHTGAEKQRLSGHSMMIRSVRFVPRSRRAVSAAADGVICLWDVDTGDEIRRFHGHKGSVESVACSSDGKRIVSGAKDDTVRIWDAESGEELRRLDGHVLHVTSVAFSPDNRFILSGSFDRTARLWDAATGTELRVFSGHQKQVLSVAFSPDGKYAVSGSTDRTARLWRLP